MQGARWCTLRAVDPETLRTLWTRAWRVLLAADDGGGTGGGAGGSGDAPPAGSGDPPAGGSGDGGANGGGSDNPEALRAELERVRREAAASRTELARLKRAGESETERRERELVEARDAAASSTAAVRTLRLENAVLKRAAQHGIVDPDVAARLLELGADAWDGDTVKADALDKALRELVKAKPYLARAGSAAAGDGGASNREGGSQGESMNDRIRLGAGRGVGRA